MRPWPQIDVSALLFFLRGRRGSDREEEIAAAPRGFDGYLPVKIIIHTTGSGGNDRLARRDPGV